MGGGEPAQQLVPHPLTLRDLREHRMVQGRRERFMRQPSAVMTEILAELDTTAERRLRRLNAQRMQEAVMPAMPITPHGTTEELDDDSASTNEIQYALLAGADVFNGAALNEEISKR